MAIPAPVRAGTRAPVSGRALAGLSLAALGVVYGDIGTSPLYALKECFSGTHSIPLTRDNVLGVLSLIFWSLNFVVSFKYLLMVMRADNRGEGGILALLALVRPKDAGGKRARWILVSLGLFGAALLYGDGVITPAISVLGAVEGLSIATPFFETKVWWITVIILIGVFAFQKRGTERVGRIFGPIMIVWFSCIAILGLRGIIQNPSVLYAASPLYALRFFENDGLQGFLVLGSVVLVVTGGEALYADMGHFGKRPIRLAWFSMVLPALVLNYFGQGALLIENPSLKSNPFYALVPGWALYPMVIIATLAAVVASQALISGAFSLTRQAVQLGYCPRVTIRHTSYTEAGQIYIPEVNAALMVACVGLVAGFRTAGNLAAAYGIAVTGTMTITTILFYVVARELWGWNRFKIGALAALFLIVDLAFLGANVVKITDGGWFPIVVAIGIYTLMTTWKRGRELLSWIMEEISLPIEFFLNDIAKRLATRVPGTAVFMTSNAGGAPPVLLHHVKHNKVLHERVILMSVRSEEIPAVPEMERMEMVDLGQGFFAVTARYGFMETPDVPAALRSLHSKGLGFRTMETTFYLGRETLILNEKSKPRDSSEEPGRWLPRWRRRLFVVMARNAQSATAFFQLPPNRVVEMGAQIQF
ncbi:MAG: KUP/HAK/KT family potassium transporter [Gemmatimonadota bacterium]